MIFSAKLTLLVPKDDAFTKVVIEAGLPDLFQMDVQLSRTVVANHIIKHDEDFEGIDQNSKKNHAQFSSLGSTQLNFTWKLDGGYLTAFLY